MKIEEIISAIQAELRNIEPKNKNGNELKYVQLDFYLDVKKDNIQLATNQIGNRYKVTPNYGKRRRDTANSYNDNNKIKLEGGKTNQTLLILESTDIQAIQQIGDLISNLKIIVYNIAAFVIDTYHYHIQIKLHTKIIDDVIKIDHYSLQSNFYDFSDIVTKFLNINLLPDKDNSNYKNIARINVSKTHIKDIKNIDVQNKILHILQSKELEDLVCSYDTNKGKRDYENKITNMFEQKYNELEKKYDKLEKQEIKKSKSKASEIIHTICEELGEFISKPDSPYKCPDKSSEEIDG